MKWKSLNALALAAVLAGALAAGVRLFLGSRRGEAEPEADGEDEAEAHPS